MQPRRTYASGLLVALALAPAALAQYDLNWYTIAGGGDMFSAGGGYELGGTIGQPDANQTAMTGGGYDLVGGFWAGASAPAPCRGDCNCDGFVNFGDINAFVAVLNGGTPCNFDNCDVNGDGHIDFGDINPFVAILSGGGGPCP